MNKSNGPIKEILPSKKKNDIKVISNNNNHKNKIKKCKPIKNKKNNNKKMKINKDLIKKEINVINGKKDSTGYYALN